MTEAHDKDDQSALIKTSVSLPLYLYEWIKEVVKTKKFNSNSSVMVVALSELKGRMDAREEALTMPHKDVPEQKQEKSAIEFIVEAYFQTEEGKRYLSSLKRPKEDCNNVSSSNNNTRILFDKDFPRRDFLE